MKHVEDESTKTICSELKVSDANFWVIIHRAKLNLKACLQRNWLNKNEIKIILMAAFQTESSL
jgi:DNA-directed RNA polymerase specialized sigma24 family protein